MGRLLLLGAAVALALVGTGAVRLRRVWVSALSDFSPPRGPVPRPAPGVLPAFEDVTFGAGVRGWLVPSANGATIVYVHGSGANRAQLVPEAAALARRGYGALVFDLPGHGESPGRVSFGRPERDAIRAALALAGRQPGVTRVGALGFSMGAFLLTQVMAEGGAAQAFVLEGAPTDAREQTRFEYRAWGPLTQWPAVWATATRMDLDEAQPQDVAPRIHAPALLVTSDDDAAVPPEMTRRLAGVLGGPSEIYVVPGSGHGGYGARAGDAYNARLAAFFDANLGKR